MADSTTGISDTTTKAPTSDVEPLQSQDTQTTSKDAAPITAAPQLDPATRPIIPMDSLVADTATLSVAISPPGQQRPTSNTSQKIEIQLLSPIDPKTDFLEAKVVIPWIVAFAGWVVAFILYSLTRKNKINDDLNDIVIEDIKEFLEKMEELTRFVASHQAGCPCQGADLKESREHLSKLRQTSVAVSNRVDKVLLNAADKDEWKSCYRKWKAATEGNTDWITNKNKKWPREAMLLLEQANEDYTGKIINFRNRIVTRKIKLKA